MLLEGEREGGSVGCDLIDSAGGLILLDQGRSLRLSCVKSTKKTFKLPAKIDSDAPFARLEFDKKEKKTDRTG